MRDSSASKPGKSKFRRLQIDLTVRYDVYCQNEGIESVYENVLFSAIRSLERPDPRSYSTSGWVELEAADGSRFLINQYDIRLICPHGIEVERRVSQI
jgi:hypothetical protein